MGAGSPGSRFIDGLRLPLASGFARSLRYSGGPALGVCHKLHTQSFPILPRLPGAPQSDLLFSAGAIIPACSGQRQCKMEVIAAVPIASNFEGSVFHGNRNYPIPRRPPHRISASSVRQSIDHRCSDRQSGKRAKLFPRRIWVATAYGACVFTIMGLAAKTHGFSIDGAKVETSKVMGTDPRRIVELVTQFTFPPNHYSAKHKENPGTLRQRMSRVQQPSSRHEKNRQLRLLRLTYARSDVQCGHRTALTETWEMQNGALFTCRRNFLRFFLHPVSPDE